MFVDCGKTPEERKAMMKMKDEAGLTVLRASWCSRIYK